MGTFEPDAAISRDQGLDLDRLPMPSNVDQSSPDEMGRQVPQMGHVYSKAERTISWLGCNGSSWVTHPQGWVTTLDHLEEDIKYIGEQMKIEGAAAKRFFAQPKLVRWTDLTKLISGVNGAVAALESNNATMDLLVSRKGLPKPSTEVTHLSCGLMAIRIGNILSMPYWSRAWVAQEVALARQVILMFGGESLDFNDFFLVYKCNRYYMSHVHGSEGVTYQPPIIPIEARAAVHETVLSFHKVLQWGYHCEASRTADRIYGLLGLQERCGDGAKTLPCILKQPIDYARDWREVYWEIVLTYHPITDPSIVYSPRSKEVIAYWVEFLPGLGRSLACPFTRENLQCAENERSTPLCSNTARLALCVAEMCGQALMDGITNLIWIWDPDTDGPASCTSSWPAQVCARELWSASRAESLSRPYQDLELLLSTLLIDTAEVKGMDGHQKYQAVVIGLTMFQRERGEGKWCCVAPQSMQGPLHNKISLECKIPLWFSGLPCTSHSPPMNKRSWWRSNHCKTSNRYLVIERTG